MFSKLAALWDESQAGGGGPITSMELVNSWQGSFSATDVSSRRAVEYSFPINEGDIVVTVVSSGLKAYGRGYYNGQTYGGRPGVSLSITESLLKYNVFYATHSAGIFFRDSSSTIRLSFYADSTTPLKQTTSTVEIKNTHTITIYHLRPDVPFDGATYALNLNSTSVAGTFGSRTSPFTNSNPVTTPADSSFTFGIISSDQYIDRYTTTTALWAPATVFDTYFAYDTTAAPRPQPTNVSADLGTGVILYNNQNNRNTPRAEVGWRYIQTVSSWMGTTTSNRGAWRIDTLVFPEAGSTYDMAHGFRWSGTASSIFQTVYFSVEISEV